MGVYELSYCRVLPGFLSSTAVVKGQEVLLGCVDEEKLGEFVETCSDNDLVIFFIQVSSTKEFVKMTRLPYM